MGGGEVRRFPPRRKRHTGTRRKPRHLEHAEQCSVVTWLRRGEVVFCAVPNGYHATSPQAAQRMVDAGLESGVPDLLIFDPPPNRPEFIGAAVEMKRIGGDKPTNEQQDWLIKLAARGWITHTCYGAAEALTWLASLGYRVPSEARA
jgi:hypothetical protein